MLILATSMRRCSLLFIYFRTRAGSQQIRLILLRPEEIKQSRCTATPVSEQALIGSPTWFIWWSHKANLLLYHFQHVYNGLKFSGIDGNACQQQGNLTMLTLSSSTTRRLIIMLGFPAVLLFFATQCLFQMFVTKS